MEGRISGSVVILDCTMLIQTQGKFEASGFPFLRKFKSPKASRSRDKRKLAKRMLNCSRKSSKSWNSAGNCCKREKRTQIRRIWLFQAAVCPPEFCQLRPTVIFSGCSRENPCIHYCIIRPAKVGWVDSRSTSWALLQCWHVAAGNYGWRRNRGKILRFLKLMRVL